MPATRLVGRTDLVGPISDLLLSPDQRLVTLTGPGGVGKTRLAVQVATELAESFPDGMAFIDLSAVIETKRVASTIARALGVAETGNQSVTESLRAALRNQRQLLVLDNFEQVVAAASLVATLLATTHLTILVTSREPLQLAAERVIVVPPLSLPAGTGELSDLADNSAVSLFIERASAVQSGFSLTSDNASHIADIVRRLDGLPLAIELAASRMSHLTPLALLARLDRSLSLLTRGPRDLPDRHQTLQKTIAWSHDLLNEREQHLFARLAVFADGWSLEAAEAICKADGDSRDETLDDLASLVSKSLVRIDSTASGQLRYRLLETIREFAADQLAMSGAEASLRARHAAWFLALAEENEFAELMGADDQNRQVLDEEFANLHAALQWFQQQEETDNLLRLAAAMRHLWIDLGYFQEGLKWLSAAREYNGLEPSTHARALVTLGTVDFYLGQLGEAERSFATALHSFRLQGDFLNASRALIGLGAVATLHGNYSAGTGYLRESLDATHQIADQQIADVIGGWAYLNLADISQAEHDLERTAELLDNALRLMRSAQFLPGWRTALGNLGDLARDRAEYDQSLAFYREALSLKPDPAGSPASVFVIEAVGVATIAVGQAEHGVQLLGAAERLGERIGLRYRNAESQVAREGALAAARAVLTADTFSAAWSSGHRMTAQEAERRALEPFPAGSSMPLPALTRREDDVLRLLVAGKSNAAIADSLFISTRTAENHVANILAKFGVSNRTAAIQAARAGGYGDPTSGTSS